MKWHTTPLIKFHNNIVTVIHVPRKFGKHAQVCMFIQHCDVWIYEIEQNESKRFVMWYTRNSTIGVSLNTITNTHTYVHTHRKTPLSTGSISCAPETFLGKNRQYLFLINIRVKCNEGSDHQNVFSAWESSERLVSELRQVQVCLLNCCELYMSLR